MINVHFTQLEPRKQTFWILFYFTVLKSHFGNHSKIVPLEDTMNGTYRNIIFIVFYSSLSDNTPQIMFLIMFLHKVPVST